MNEDLSAMTDICEDLSAHLALCQRILREVEVEADQLKNAAEFDHSSAREAKKSLLVQLNESLDKIRKDRRRWQELSALHKEANQEIPSLLRQNQDVIMKIIVLTGENEQALLRRGLVPARHLPPANRQRPHFVADLYRRNATC